ncbi:pyridoxamine kinase [Oribacterium sp. WCC10]|uniref:pyridoxamine kinase n=1 Tax=Oribacterium sp. WCC10 TaxID=1855343 RepID=UPI001587802E|nr:pyridoxamine kinase [Oribacterium sp. WCC10]
MKKLAIINDLSGVGRSSLSIQLPVVSCLGITACPVPTAILSSHTAFNEVSKVNFSDHMTAYFDAWDKNDFRFDGILIGYLGDENEQKIIEQFIVKQREKNPDVKVILDPVMADHGKLYRHMSDRNISALRSLAKHADLICPNLTEAAFLADYDYEGLRETLDSCNHDSAKAIVFNALLSALHHITNGTVVITGVEDISENDEDCLLNVLSESDGDVRFIRNPKTGNNRPGTGDLFSAILASKLIKGTEPENACRTASVFVGRAIRHSENEHVPVTEGVQFEDLLHQLSD